MLINTALFLLEHPPLDEIGGAMIDIIESYRFGSLTKEVASQQLITQFKPALTKYTNRSSDINELIYN